MSDLIEGMGTAATGGLFSRALEPHSGAQAPHPEQPDNCLNCGAPLAGAYCSACGQRGHLHRTLGGFTHDLLHGALHFEGKLWRTLPMLVLRPGRLTRRYIDGERARFVSPMALFLFCVFLMFAAFQGAGLTTPTDLSNYGIDQTSPPESARAELVAERDRSQATVERTPATGAQRVEAERELDQVQEALEEFDRGLIQFRTQNGSNVGLSGIDRLGSALVDKWRQHPELMLYKLQANAYKFSWLLIPLSIPFVWMLFAWRRRFKAYDHAIFVTYSLSFMTLLFVVVSLLGLAGIEVGALAIAVVLIVPIHLYKQLRHAYDLSRFSAFWRLLVLSMFIWIIVALFLQALLLLGAF